MPPITAPEFLFLPTLINTPYPDDDLGDTPNIPEQSCINSKKLQELNEQSTFSELGYPNLTPSNDMICPISLELMDDPVCIAESSAPHAYERSQLEFWLTQHRTNPITGEPLPAKCSLISDVLTKKKINDFIINGESIATCLKENLNLHNQLAQYLEKHQALCRANPFSSKFSFQVSDSEKCKVAQALLTIIKKRTDFSKLHRHKEAISHGELADFYNRVKQNCSSLSELESIQETFTLPAIERTPITRGVYSSPKVTTELNKIFHLYKLKELSQQTLEKALRTSAANNKLNHTQFFLDILNININAADTNPNSKKTALHHAANRKHIHIVLFLLNRNADKTLIDANKKTPAMLTEVGSPIHNLLTRSHGLASSTTTMIPTLFTSSTINHRLNKIFKTYKIKRITPQNLEQAVRRATANNSQTDLLFLLDVYKVNVNAVDSRVRRSALHHAAIRGYVDIAKILLNNNADPTILDSNGKTPLMLTQSGSPMHKLLSGTPPIPPNHHPWSFITATITHQVLHKILPLSRP